MTAAPASRGCSMVALMKPITMLALACLALSGCKNEEPAASVPSVELRGRLEVDQEKTSARQAQGIEGEYFRRVLTVDGSDMTLDAFINHYCPAGTRDETCQKALRIKKIDDVSGATRFLPHGL